MTARITKWPQMFFQKDKPLTPSREAEDGTEQVCGLWPFGPFQFSEGGFGPSRWFKGRSTSLRSILRTPHKNPMESHTIPHIILYKSPCFPLEVGFPIRIPS